MRTKTLIVLASLWLGRVEAQTVLFDFENASLGSSLLLSLVVGGIKADFSSSGIGGFYVQQPPNASLPNPPGFSGNCLIPSSVYAADLLIGFSQTLADFAVLYSPQELACDASATMQVTAFLNNTLVGTATTNATAQCTCTWASEWLRFTSSQGFNRVVVHYVAPGPGCQDYGPIFMADNVTVTLAPPPIILENPARSTNGVFQFSFTNQPGASFTVLRSTNANLPFANWNGLGSVPEVAPGFYQFSDLQATNQPLFFYRVRSL